MSRASLTPVILPACNLIQPSPRWLTSCSRMKVTTRSTPKLTRTATTTIQKRISSSKYECVGETTAAAIKSKTPRQGDLVLRNVANCSGSFIAVHHPRPLFAFEAGCTFWRRWLRLGGLLLRKAQIPHTREHEGTPLRT